MRVWFHPAAAAEVGRAQAWCEERSILAAAGFLQALTRVVQRIRVAPERTQCGNMARAESFSNSFPAQRSTWCGVMTSSSLQSPIRGDALATGRLVLACPSSQNRDAPLYPLPSHSHAEPGQHLNQDVGAEQINAATQKIADSRLCYAQVPLLVPRALSGSQAAAKDPAASGSARSAHRLRAKAPLHRQPG